MQRKILLSKKSEETLEGAGVRLKRAFSHDTTKLTDPFLLLDHFKSSDSDDYMAGFPWHPHRGIETVTYMISGKVEHQDSLKNKGVINDGEVQWMTAGSGIVHQEMPIKTKEENHGFQLWVNLSKKNKMIHPKYRSIPKKELTYKKIIDGVLVKVISGELLTNIGSIKELSHNINYFDVNINTKKEYSFNTKKEDTCIIYIYEGEVKVDNQQFGENSLIIFSKGDNIKVESLSNSKFLFLSGPKLNEPIEWYGPIVMNTKKEIETAFREYREGTFIKHD